MTPPRSNAEQFLRTLSVLAWFRNHPDGSLMEASRTLGLSTPQITHELGQVSMCRMPESILDMPVEVTVDRMRASVKFSAGLDHPVALNSLEAGVLLLNLQALRSTAPPEMQQNIDSASDKIQTLLRARREYTEAFTPETTPSAPAFLPLRRRLAEAIQTRRQLTFNYQSLSSDTFTSRIADPDHVALVDGEYYLWARESGVTTKTFALSRIDALDLGEEGSASPQVQPDIDPQDPFGFEETDEWARVELDESLRWMLEYFPMWVVEDESRLVVDVPNTGEWFMRFLLGFSPGIRVLEPLPLAENLKVLARRGLDAYEARGLG